MIGKTFFLVAIAIAAPLCLLVEGQVSPAPDCNNATCKLPDCLCSSPANPKNLTEAETPQLVFLTFDDAVSVDNFAFYQETLNNRKNPNNAPISATFFVSHEYSNYSMLAKLWQHGHEIALHSISHNPSAEYWRDLASADWIKEVVQQRDQMVQFGRIPPADVTGFRAPHLQTGGDVMYDILSKNNFKWDCSRPTLNYRSPGMWPYTNDHASVQDCQIPPCPVGAYKGFWTVPMIDLIGDDNQACAMVDQCVPLPITPESTFELLKRNFNTSYYGNKAPFGIYVHHGWMNGTGGEDSVHIWERRRGYEQFLDHLATLKDVYIVSVSKAIEWIKNGPPVSGLANYDGFKQPSRTSTCGAGFECKYTPDRTPPGAQERIMNSCIPCPPYYPFVGNHLGRTPYTKKLLTSAP